MSMMSTSACIVRACFARYDILAPSGGYVMIGTFWVSCDTQSAFEALSANAPARKRNRRETPRKLWRAGFSPPLTGLRCATRDGHCALARARDAHRQPRAGYTNGAFEALSANPCESETDGETARKLSGAK